MTPYSPLPRHLARTPTPSNVAAATDLSRSAAREAVRRIGAAARALHALAETDYPSTAQQVTAVAAWHGAEAEIHAAVIDVAAAAVLGGAAVSTTARGALGVRPQTLSCWLAGTVAQLRGLEIKLVDGSWKPSRTPDLHEPAATAANPADSGAGDTDRFAGTTGADTPGGQTVSRGADADAAGA